MIYINDVNDLKRPLKNPVLTIGNFDGVHKGHVTLFRKVKGRATAIGGQAAVMTFDPHPLKVMRPGNGPSLLTTTEQKTELIEAVGMDVLFCLPFSRDFAEISAQAFVRDILIKTIGLKEIVVGYDYCFGRNREGNIGLLQDMGRSLGFIVHVVGPVVVDNMPVSSTSIRNLLREGNLEQANAFLGRDYQIMGTVVRGADRGGRLLGFPTANILLPEALTPQEGVYAVTVQVDETSHFGLTNVGHNPTFGNAALSIETHLLDFSGDLLGKTIRIDFVHRLRSERAFGSVEDLVEQIKSDIIQARNLFGIRESARVVA